MEIKRKITGDIDKVYEKDTLECVNIFSFIFSKGDIKTNKISNKFYNIEILKNAPLFYIVTTSGALGGSLDNVVVIKSRNEKAAKEAFLQKVEEKQKQGYKRVEVVTIYPHCSASARNFVQAKRVLSRDEAQKIKENSKLEVKVEVKDRDVKVENKKELDKRVAKFVKDIYDEIGEELRDKMSAESFQNENSMFGVLSHVAYNEGRNLLNLIAEKQNKLAVAKRNRDKIQSEIVNLSNQYNMTIPRKIKRGTLDWLLDTADKLAEQYELIDLLELTLSNSVLGSKKETDIWDKYVALNSDITVVTDEKILRDIKEKMRKEQLANHHERVKLLNVFEVNQKNAPTFNDSCGNVVSLFHGTRAANMVSILSSSIKLPANLGSNVVITGRMFGSGVYFGQFSKSLQYSVAKFGGTQNKGNRSYIFICDVALGKMKFEPFGKNYAQAPQGYNSVMGVGADAYKEGCEIKGIGNVQDFKIPASVFRREVPKLGYLMHNEYIVYNQTRFRIRYILELERQ